MSKVFATKMFGAVAGALLAFMLLAPAAEAHCWWNGYRWHCAGHRYHHHAGYRYYHPYYRYGYYPYYHPYYRPYYACVFPFCR